MFGKRYVKALISRSTNDPAERRSFLRSASVAGLGLVGASVLGSTVTAGKASAAESPSVSDGAIFNFALNLEYLEAEFYSYAVNGHGLPDNLTHGTGQRGPVQGGRAVKFRSSSIRQFAAQIALDEHEHVAFFRKELGSAAVARPAINIQDSFTAVATAAGLIKPGQTFDPFASEDNFLRGAFIFEDVGVTAFKGAAPLINNKAYLGAAAGILAVEAYHAANVRTALYERGGADDANAISAARRSLNPGTNLDQGLTVNGRANIVPADDNGVAFARTPGQVLNIVYLTPKPATKGGFYPHGVNGTVNASA
jgi:Ferritin-like domain